MRFCILILLALGTARLHAEDDATRRAAIRAELSIIAEQVRLSRAFNLIHELVRPSVVSIRISEARWRFDRIRDVEVGEGSGFVIHSDDEASYILTNAHVVLQVNQDRDFIRSRDNQPVWYDRIRVFTHENEALDAEPVGADPETDLAVLRVAKTHMPVIAWGDSDRVEVGDYTVALGYPLRVGYSATFGNISATDKSTEIYRREQGYEAFLQTDAAINPGNSGGPLVDLRGEVIGVNASILSRGGGNIGIGFAIPSRLAARVAEDLRQYGHVRRPMIGIQMDDELDPEEIARLAIPNRSAVKITLVLPGSPAEEAGLRDGDVILAVDGVEVQGVQQFRTRIASVRLEQPVELTVWREGSQKTLAVTPVSREELQSRLTARVRIEGREAVRWERFGLILAKDAFRGVVIKTVQPGGPAAQVGLQQGDRILRVHGSGTVDSLDDVRGLDQRNELVLLVYHDGHPYLVRLRR